MTLSTTINKASYAGDGATVSFAIPFLFLGNADIQVVLRDTSGAETTWTLNTEYMLTGAGDPAGGTLNVSTDPADYTPVSGETLIIRRVVPETQETDYPEGGAFPAIAHEQALDKLTMLVQQQSEEIARSLRLPVSSPLSDIRVPEPGGGELIRWNAGGEALETVALGNLALDIPAVADDPARGDAFLFDGTHWVNAPAGALDVRLFGAVGNGSADDGAAIAAALAAAPGRAVYFPPGIYAVGSGTAAHAAAVTVTADDTHVVLAPGATVRCLNTAAGSAAIRISASRVRIEGGCFEGTWDMAGQDTSDVAASDGSCMLHIKAGASDLRDIAVEGVRFRRGTGYALRADQNDALDRNYANLRLVDLQFDENVSAIYLANYHTAQPVEGVTMDRLAIRDTARPDPALSDADYGGNGIFTVGPFDGLRLTNSRIAGVGRMAVEFWVNPEMQTATMYSRNVAIENCDLEYAQYRTLSAGAYGMSIRNCRVVSGALSSHWLELYGRNILFEGNDVTGAGWFATEPPTEANPKTGYVCRANRFADVTGQRRAPAVLMRGVRNAAITDNFAVYSHAVEDGVKLPVFDIRNSQTAYVGQNKIEFNSPCDRESVINFTHAIGGKVSNNLIRMSGVGNNQIYTVWNIGALQNCLIEGNTTHSDSQFSVSGPSPIGGPMIGSGTFLYQWDNDAFQITAGHNAILNAPPVLPVADLPYPVGDSPTGAWAGRPRSIAVHDGGTWSFFPIRDAFVYRPDDAAWDNGHLPQAGSGTDSYLLCLGGWINCIVRNNDFAHSNGISSGSGTGIQFNQFGSAGSGIVWNSRFENNVDQVMYNDFCTIRRAVVVTRPSYGVPASLRHEAGAVVPNADPSANGIREWVCVAGGTPGTFHAVTIRDPARRIVLFDDFTGPALNTGLWLPVTGTDPQAVAARHLNQVRGTVAATSGNSNPGTTAVDAAGLVSACEWRASNGGLVLDARIALDDVSEVTAFVGFTDTTALERPTESDGSTGQTAAAADCVGFLYDTDHDFSRWLAVGAKAGAATAPVDTGIAPADLTYVDLRVEVGSSGNSTFYVDGLWKGHVVDSVSPAATLTPAIVLMERSTSTTRTVYCDYLQVEMRR